MPPIRVVFLLVYRKGLEPGAVVNEAPVEPQSGTLSEAAAECSSPYIPTPLSPQARIQVPTSYYSNSSAAFSICTADSIY